MGDLIKIELTDFNLTDYYGDTAVGIALSLIKKKKNIKISEICHFDNAMTKRINVYDQLHVHAYFHDVLITMSV